MEPIQENIWLGDLSGFQIETHFGAALELITSVTHRCGWKQEIEVHDSYLANIVDKCMRHREAGCIPKE